MEHSLVLFKIDLPPSTSTAVTLPTLPFLPPPHYLQLDLKNLAIGSLWSFRTWLAHFHSLLLLRMASLGTVGCRYSAFELSLTPVLRLILTASLVFLVVLSLPYDVSTCSWRPCGHRGRCRRASREHCPSPCSCIRGGGHGRECIPNARILPRTVPPCLGTPPRHKQYGTPLRSGRTSHCLPRCKGNSRYARTFPLGTGPTSPTYSAGCTQMSQ